MSRCGKTAKLEAWVDGELSVSEATALKLHTERCAVCTHEHRWLQTEKALFEQRASREWSQPYWSRFAKDVSRKRLWALTAAVAAGWVMFIVAQSELRSSHVPRGTEHSVEMSQEVASVEVDVACHSWFGSVGDSCGPAVLATFASRD